jgi:hypothetical protein
MHYYVLAYVLSFKVFWPVLWNVWNASRLECSSPACLGLEASWAVHWHMSHL